MSTDLTPYRDWAPTGFDVRGLALPDRADWYVTPCILTRDSNALQRANYRAMTDAIRAADTLERVDTRCGNTFEIHDFGHWACGWIRIVIVRPDSDAARVAADISAGLADYPVVSDSVYSEEEHAEACATWDSMSIRDRIHACALYGVSIFAARHDHYPDDPSGSLFLYLAGS